MPEAIKETEGYAVSLRRRKMIEEAFGWVKEIGTLGRVMLRGLDRICGEVLLNFAAYNPCPYTQLTRFRCVAPEAWRRHP